MALVEPNEFNLDFVADDVGDDKGHLRNLLPDYLTDNPVWAEFADIVETVVQREVWANIERFSTFRDPKVIGLHEPTVTLKNMFMSLLGSLLGFSQKSQYFTEDGYRRILSGLANYYEQSGTKYTGVFMGYLNDTASEIVPLYAEYPNYSDFTDKPDGKTIYEGGKWYLTPHCWYRYRFDRSDVADLITPEIIKNLFYELAPINLVLEGVLGVANSMGELGLAAAWKYRVCYEADVYPISGTLAAAWKYRINI